MTELDQLAKLYYEHRPEGFGNPTDDFRAGFNAALEICSGQSRNLIDAVLRFSDVTPGPWMSGCSRHISSSINRLGESQVKP